MIFEQGKWYRYIGDRDEPAWVNSMTCVFDGRPRKCIAGGDSGHYVKFQRLLGDPGDLMWQWGDHFEQCTFPNFYAFIFYLHPFFKVKKTGQVFKTRSIDTGGVVYEGKYFAWSTIKLATRKEYRRQKRVHRLQVTAQELSSLCSKTIWDDLFKEL